MTPTGAPGEPSGDEAAVDTPLAPRRLRVDEILGAAARALGVGLPGFVGLAAATHLPYLVCAAVVAGGGRWDVEIAWRWFVLDRAYGLVAAPLLSAMVIHAMLARLDGRPAPWRANCAAVLRRLRPLIGVAFFATMCSLAGALLVALIASWATSLLALEGTARAQLVLAASLAPGIVVMTALYLAAPAAMVERVDAAGAVARSWALVRGSVRAFAVLMILSSGPKLAFEWALLDAARAPAGAEDHETVRALIVASAAVALAGALFTAIAAAAAYRIQRTRRDGASAEGVAAVFE